MVGGFLEDMGEGAEEGLEDGDCAVVEGVGGHSGGEY